MAGGLHFAASSMSLETMREPATPIPSPRAPAVSAAEFSFDISLGDWEADSESSWALQAAIISEDMTSFDLVEKIITESEQSWAVEVVAVAYLLT